MQRLLTKTPYSLKTLSPKDSQSATCWPQDYPSTPADVEERQKGGLFCLRGSFHRPLVFCLLLLLRLLDLLQGSAGGSLDSLVWIAV